MTETETRATWPALASLNREQREALDGFRRGFGRRRGLLVWLLRFQHLTLGEVAHDRYAALGARRPIVGALLTSDRRERFLEDPQRVPPERAAETRRRLAARHLRPACTAAYGKLRTQAVEYLDDDRPDPELASATALRPGLDDLHGTQRENLKAFLDGFDDVDAAEEWAHELDEAHRGHLADEVDTWDYQILTGAERRALVEDGPAYRFAREQVAARFLLPAFNRAVRELADKAGETGETDSPNDHTPEPYR